MNKYVNYKCQYCENKPIRAVAKCELCNRFICFRHRKVGKLAYSVYQKAESTSVMIPLCPDCSLKKHPTWLYSDIDKLIKKLVQSERKNRGPGSE